MKTKKTFHIVCEGNTDFEVLRVVASKVGELNNGTYKTVALFPPKPKANAGWPNLKIWCKRQASLLTGTMQAQAQTAAALLGAKSLSNAKKRQADLITAALLLKQEDARSAIIVQIDSDIASDLLNDIGIPKDAHALPLCPRERIRICEAALDAWLGPHATKKGDKIHYCITTLALENWILTLHSEKELGIPKGANYDHIHSPDDRLVALGYPSSNGELKKDPPKYKRYAEQLTGMLPAAIQKSPSLYAFCATLSAV